MCGETRIPSDICAGKHASLGICVRKHASLGNTYHWNTGIDYNYVAISSYMHYTDTHVGTIHVWMLCQATIDY